MYKPFINCIFTAHHSSLSHPSTPTPLLITQRSVSAQSFARRETRRRSQRVSQRQNNVHGAVNNTGSEQPPLVVNGAEVSDDTSGITEVFNEFD
jgi:hypothetical protein